MNIIINKRAHSLFIVTLSQCGQNAGCTSHHVDIICRRIWSSEQQALPHINIVNSGEECSIFSHMSMM